MPELALHSTKPEGKDLHWLVVGYVSPSAQQWIEKRGGQVRPVSDEPPLVAVGLAYNPDGAWVYSHGRQEHRQGIEFWTTGEIQEASTGITLQYQSMHDRTEASYCSVESTYLILPDETFDPETHQVKEPENQPESEHDFDAAALLSLDDHPF